VQLQEQINQFFDKIFVICLERNFEKQKDKLFRNLAGVNYEIFWAIDGKALPKDDLSSLYNAPEAQKELYSFMRLRYNTNVHRDLNLSEIGCSLSHISIYKRIAELNLDKVLILEEDAVINPNFGLDFNGYVQNIPAQYDLIYWGYRWHDCETKLARLKRQITNILTLRLGHNKRYPSRYNRWFSFAGMHAGTHAYSVSAKFARELIGGNMPVKFNADHFLISKTFLTQKRCFVCIPKLFINDSSHISTLVNG
jgi:glycosyl transferase family 25